MMSTEHSLSAGFGSPAAAPAASRGRGAVTNVRHRFEQTEREAFDDGWFGGDHDAPSPFDLSLDDIQDVPRRLPASEDPAGAEAVPPADSASLPGALPEAVGLPAAATQRYIPVVAAPRTTVKPEQARKLLSRNDSPDIPFDVAVNPYRGCEHGCVYCYARPTHAYLGYSPGLDFETRLVAKANAVQALRAELSRPGYKVSPINIGSATDVYQPIERTWRLTRGLLELMVETGHPLTLVTKNSLVERDLDLLTTLARERLVTVFISITTLDATWRAPWSRGPRRRGAGSRRCASWPRPACPWACWWRPSSPSSMTNPWSRSSRPPPPRALFGQLHGRASALGSQRRL